MERLGAQAKYERLHREKPYHNGDFTSWGEKQTDAHPYRLMDGVTIWSAASDLSPDDDFLNRGSGAPLTPPTA